VTAAGAALDVLRRDLLRYSFAYLRCVAFDAHLRNVEPDALVLGRRPGEA